MPSTLETILTALQGALETGLATATVVRGENLPTIVERDALVILRDGDPGEPEQTFSPLRYHYEHVAEIELFVPSTPARDAVFDAVKMQIGAIIVANRNLGGADWIEAMAPQPADLPVDGADTIKAASIPVVLHFWTSDPLS